MRSYISGNTADLSQVKINDSGLVNLLINDSNKTFEKLNESCQMDIVLDNSGEELLYDLLFSHWLLSHTGISKVNLHFKPFPYFVSDAMIKDFHFLLDAISTDEPGTKFSRLIRDYVSCGKLNLFENHYWTDVNDYSEIPFDIEKIFSSSGLVVFKGDLNYRKLVEDRHWDYRTATKDIITFKKNNSLIIRVLKSELITGLESVPDIANNEWMYNGKYGIIQFVEKSTTPH
jgi:hypothetical protein